MKYALLSGKGGTGKTLCAINLAAVCPGSIYMDCDIEEPDGHLFFKPKITQSYIVSAFLPKIDPALCDGCRQCVDFCRFNALAMIGASITVFSDVCHSCGGCEIVCPKKAISDEGIEIGVIEDGLAGKNRVITGCMHLGRESGVPIIREMMKMVNTSSNHVFIDCPPGTSCATIESIKSADFCVFVTEPTSFGAHDLEMIYDLVKSENKSCAVILNKTGPQYDPSESFCRKMGIPILGSIPYDAELGKINSNALIAVWERLKYRRLFRKILSHIFKEVNDETIAHPQR